MLNWHLCVYDLDCSDEYLMNQEQPGTIIIESMVLF